jgi:hypothetical protein
MNLQKTAFNQKYFQQLEERVTVLWSEMNSS